jgi:hypothetical protein
MLLGIKVMSSKFSFGLIWMQYSLVIFSSLLPSWSQSEGLKFLRRVRFLFTTTEKIALEGSKLWYEVGLKWRRRKTGELVTVENVYVKFERETRAVVNGIWIFESELVVFGSMKEKSFVLSILSPTQIQLSKEVVFVEEPQLRAKL